MNKATRMMLLNRGRQDDRRRVGFEYEWMPRDHYGPYMPTTYDRPPEGAFYDDRGRRHYDDGRFAPQNSYMPMDPWSEGGSDSRMDRGMGRDSGYSQQDGPRSYHSTPRMIGFARDWRDEGMRSDATMPQYREMDQMHGQRGQGGYASGTGLPRFDQRMAQEWTQSMVNADGTKGPHWPMEKTKEIMRQYDIDCDPVEFWAVMNSLYSDFCEALKKPNASTLETYARLAKAWLDDDDAVRDKASAYFTYVVEHR